LKNAVVVGKVVSEEHHPRPENCGELFYKTVMEPCWKHDPEQRPTFSMLLDTIERSIEATSSAPMPASAASVGQSGMRSFAKSSTSKDADRMQTSDTMLDTMVRTDGDDFGAAAGTMLCRESDSSNTNTFLPNVKTGTFISSEPSSSATSSGVGRSDEVGGGGNGNQSRSRYTGDGGDIKDGSDSDDGYYQTGDQNENEVLYTDSRLEGLGSFAMAIAMATEANEVQTVVKIKGALGTISRGKHGAVDEVVVANNQ
jgi:hypothetical protein